MDALTGRGVTRAAVTPQSSCVGNGARFMPMAFGGGPLGVTRVGWGQEGGPHDGIGGSVRTGLGLAPPGGRPPIPCQAPGLPGLQSHRPKELLA